MFKPNDKAILETEYGNVVVTIKGAVLIEGGIQYIVELQEVDRFYSPNRKFFVSLLVVHSDNLKELK